MLLVAQLLFVLSVAAHNDLIAERACGMFGFDIECQNFVGTVEQAVDWAILLNNHGVRSYEAAWKAVDDGGNFYIKHETSHRHAKKAKAFFEASMLLANRVRNCVMGRTADVQWT